ncbi:hypothetical protein CCP3SC5AM1_1750009 [Gammaproteobacteria bacterium]
MLNINNTINKIYLGTNLIKTLSYSFLNYFSDLNKEKIIDINHELLLVGYVSIPQYVNVTNFKMNFQGNNNTFFVNSFDSAYYNVNYINVTIAAGMSGSYSSCKTYGPYNVNVLIPEYCYGGYDDYVSVSHYETYGDPNSLNFVCTNSTGTFSFYSISGPHFCSWNVYNFNATINSNPKNCSIYVGNLDGSFEFNNEDLCNITNITTNLFETINNYTSTCSFDNYCNVPIYTYSKTSGTINISNINISYHNNINEVVINSSHIQTF